MAQQPQHDVRTAVPTENESISTGTEKTPPTSHSSKIRLREIRAWAARLKRAVFKMRNKRSLDSPPLHSHTKRVDRDLVASRQETDPPPSPQDQHLNEDMLLPETDEVDSHVEPTGGTISTSSSRSSEDDLSPDLAHASARSIPERIPSLSEPLARRSSSSVSTVRSKRRGFEAKMRIFVPGDFGNKRTQPRYGLIDTGAVCSFTYRSVVDKLLGHEVTYASKKRFTTMSGEVESIGVVPIIWRMQGQSEDLDDFKTTIQVLPDPEKDDMVQDFDFLLGRDWIRKYKVFKRNSRIWGRGQLHTVSLSSKWGGWRNA